MKCELCAAVAGEATAHPRFGESDDAIALLHSDWAVKGHAMIVARRHVENISDLTEEEAARFIRFLRMVERRLLDFTKADRAILLKLGLATPHLHVHIYPVPQMFDRTAVQRAIDGKVRYEADEEEKEALLRELRG